MLATDVIDRHFDPITQRLHTTRLHLKRGKLPTAVVKLLPKSFLGSTRNNSSESYVLEKSVVDIKEGWMHTENRNLEWTGVLTVVERQRFQRPIRQSLSSTDQSIQAQTKPYVWNDHHTDVHTSVTLHSRLGQNRYLRNRSKRLSEAGSDTVEEPKQGFFAALSSSGIQRSVEVIGLRRATDHLRKSREGMKVVLERLRTGGLVGVLEGMRQDRAASFGTEGPWKRALHHGSTDVGEGPATSPHLEDMENFEKE